MACRSAAKGSSHRQRRRHETSVASLQDQHQKYSNFRNDQESNDEICARARWMVPVFGVAAAASIALYTGYLKNLKRRAAAVRNIESKAFKTSRKLVDLSLTAKNGLLVKSRSAFV